MEARNQENKEKLAEAKRKRGLETKRFPREEVKLAAAAIGFNARLRSSDMPVHIQEHALRCARSFVDSSPQRRPNNTLLARSLKKEFDSLYGPAWHCVVGTSFGSFVTHSPGGFVYFSADSLSVLLFKTEVQLVIEPTREVKVNFGTDPTPTLDWSASDTNGMVRKNLEVPQFSN